MQTIKMTNKLVKILCFFTLFYAQICTAEIRIAIVVPKTGEYKVWGDEIIFGAQTAIDEIKQKGGIKGKKLELTSIDDTCSENLAISTAQMLSVSSSIKPSLVIGPYCSNSFSEVAKIYSKAKIFQIVPSTLNYHDTSLKYKGVMKLVSFKEQMGKDFFAFYNTKYAGFKTALIYDNKTDGTKEVIHAIVDEFRKHGKNSLLKQYDLYNYKNLDSLASEIASSEYKIVYLAGSPKKNAKIIKKVSLINSDKIFITSKYTATDTFFENASGYLDNVYFMALPSFENRPEFTEHLVNLRLRGIEFDGLNIYGYAAVKMWTDLVKDTGSLSYDKLANSIQTKKTSNVWKNSFFNNTSSKNPLHYMFYQYKNGEFILSE